MSYPCFSIDILQTCPSIGVGVNNTYNCCLWKGNSRTNQLKTRFQTTYSNRMYCSSHSMQSLTQFSSWVTWKQPLCGINTREMLRTSDPLTALLAEAFNDTGVTVVASSPSVSCAAGRKPRKGISLETSFPRRLSKFHIRNKNCLAHASDRISLSSSAALSTMAEVEKVSVLDVKKAGVFVTELRGQFNSGKTKSYEWRVTQLKNLSRMFEEKEKEIIQALDEDLSKPEFEAYVAEIAMLKSSCKLALKDLKKWMKPEKVRTPVTTFPSSAEIVSEPLGIVLIISTWNYPFLLSLDPVIGAIAAGNAVVLKPSEVSPATSTLLKDLLQEYVDTATIKVVEGAIDETSVLLEQKWDKIFYTGSGKVGRIVMAAAAKHLTPVILELGGKCPAVVDSNVNLKVAARRIIAGKWGCNNGQTCTAIDYILTTKAFAPELINALRIELEKCFGKDPMASKDMSRVVTLYHFNRLMKLLSEEGVSSNIVLGGQTDENPLRIAPTILLDAPEEATLMKEEIFGPLLPIVTVENLKDSFEIIKSKSKPLAAYLFTENDKLKKEFVNDISAGGILINDTIVHLTVATLPFGGVGESGMGNYHGKFSFDAFSHKKSVLYRGFGGDASVRYPPYTPKKLNLLKALMSGSIFQIILTLLGLSKG